MWLINLIVQWNSHSFSLGVFRIVAINIDQFLSLGFMYYFQLFYRSPNRPRLAEFLLQSHLVLQLYFYSSYSVLILPQILILKVILILCIIGFSSLMYSLHLYSIFFKYKCSLFWFYASCWESCFLTSYLPYVSSLLWCLCCLLLLSLNIFRWMISIFPACIYFSCICLTSYLQCNFISLSASSFSWVQEFQLLSTAFFLVLISLGWGFSPMCICYGFQLWNTLNLPFLSLYIFELSQDKYIGVCYTGI